MGRKRFYAGALLVSCVLALCGCGLKQEEGKTAILVGNGAADSYEMTQAQKGKIQKTKILVANYQQVRSENLSFQSGGRRLEAVYVSMGYTVEKGDLLAEVYCDEEKEELANLKYQIKTQQMKIEQLKEQKELELTQLARKKGSMTAVEYEAKIAALEDNYRIQSEDLEDSIFVEQLEYDALYQWIEGCKIYATMDGTITYLRDTSSAVVWAGEKVMSISDSAECAFLCDDVEYASYFTVGDTYEFATSTGVTYETVLTEVDVDEKIMRFELATPQYNMTMGQRVLYSLVLDEREDALSIPKSAVYYVGDQAYVYYFDKAGDRQIKSITVGLQADSRVEVLDGLVEGEEVILR